MVQGEALEHQFGRCNDTGCAEGSTCELLREADRALRDLMGEDWTNWEHIPHDQAACATHLAGEAFNVLNQCRGSLQTAGLPEIPRKAEIREYRSFPDEVKLSELSTNIRQATKLQQKNVDAKVYECNMAQARRLTTDQERLDVSRECFHLLCSNS